MVSCLHWQQKILVLLFFEGILGSWDSCSVLWSYRRVIFLYLCFQSVHWPGIITRFVAKMAGVVKTAMQRQVSAVAHARHSRDSKCTSYNLSSPQFSRARLQSSVHFSLEVQVENILVIFLLWSCGMLSKFGLKRVTLVGGNPNFQGNTYCNAKRLPCKSRVSVWILGKDV
jgi:hypothetical protein